MVTEFYMTPPKSPISFGSNTKDPKSQSLINQKKIDNTVYYYLEWLLVAVTNLVSFPSFTIYNHSHTHKIIWFDRLLLPAGGGDAGFIWSPLYDAIRYSNFAPVGGTFH
jgi:hypothetical protein